MSKYPNISLIICTEKRPKRLKELLLSLDNLRHKNLEVLIIDLSRTDENKKLTRQFVVKYFHKPNLNLSQAKNFGIKQSSGELIVFTDDDCQVTKQWILFLLRNFNDKKIAACTGRVLEYKKEGNGWFFNLDKGPFSRVFKKEDLGFLGFLKAIFSFKKNFPLGSQAPAPWSIGAGCNVIFKREIFDKIGFFDEAMGPKTSKKSAEDIDIFYRILKAGFKIAYEPRAIVYHNPEGNFENLLVKSRDYGVGMGALIKKHIKKNPALFFHFCARVFQILIEMIKNIQNKKRLILLRNSLTGLFWGFLR